LDNLNNPINGDNVNDARDGDRRVPHDEIQGGRLSKAHLFPWFDELVVLERTFNNDRWTLIQQWCSGDTLHIWRSRSNNPPCSPSLSTLTDTIVPCYDAWKELSLPRHESMDLRSPDGTR
jgi:hypothetical protein